MLKKCTSSRQGEGGDAQVQQIDGGRLTNAVLNTKLLAGPRCAHYSPVIGRPENVLKHCLCFRVLSHLTATRTPTHLTFISALFPDPQLSPYVTMMAFSILGGVAYCWLTNTRGFSRALASRVISGAAFALSVAVFPCFGLARSSITATLLSSLALASAALSRGGWSTKHMEIAANPDHAAMLYSVANTISAAASVAGISATGKLLDTYGGGGEPRAWTMAMGAVGAACGVCGVVFVCCARGDEILFPVDSAGGSGAAVVTGATEDRNELERAWGSWSRWPLREKKPETPSWPQPFGWTADMSPA